MRRRLQPSPMASLCSKLAPLSTVKRLIALIGRLECLSRHWAIPGTAMLKLTKKKRLGWLWNLRMAVERLAPMMVMALRLVFNTRGQRSAIDTKMDPSPLIHGWAKTVSAIISTPMDLLCVVVRRLMAAGIVLATTVACRQDGLPGRTASRAFSARTDGLSPVGTALTVQSTISIRPRL